MKAVITVGISASGKSTLAEQYTKDKSWVELNRDNIREVVCRSKRVGYDHTQNIWAYWKNKWEQEVTKIFDAELESVLGKKNIVFSNTNLNPAHMKTLIGKLTDAGYSVEIVEMNVEFDHAVQWDLNRKNSLGIQILRAQWKKWLDYLANLGKFTVYKQDTSLPRAVMFDIDGTVAHMEDMRSPYEWDKVHLDKPDNLMQIFISALVMHGIEIVFLSGRDEVCRELTDAWIRDHFNLTDFKLHMRPTGDMRKDNIVKKELFFDHVADNYNVLAVFDDRPQVVRLWHDLGLKVWATGDQLIEF